MSEEPEVHHGGMRAGGRKRTEKAKPDARTKFRGVSRQPSGRYGAQIRESKGKAHTHTWLGTFDKDEDAARVYDAAAVKRRGPAAITNFQQPIAVDVQDSEALIAAETLQHMSLAVHGDDPDWEALIAAATLQQMSLAGHGDDPDWEALIAADSPADVASWPWR
ncbi:hypothetical protein QYE76_020411 [Lolium multiflorum]|uniref:AP2/ERF domain-containing protein n=1 Tax=Lolium multiflorum TaxID=4521 RepID=A0AAD8R8B2_LOLMU|nr:hypothetical protein QYE76_020411 [Lolium multiflorum]